MGVLKGTLTECLVLEHLTKVELALMQGIGGRK